MATLQERIEDIIKELTRLHTLPGRYRDKDDDFGLPRMIATGNGDSIVVSRAIDQAIIAVADQLMAADATLAPKFTRAEWRSTVRRAFGPALAPINLDEDLSKNAVSVLADIRNALAMHVANHGLCEFTFGCTLFGNTNIHSFSIGPVHFEPRLDWLRRKHQQGAVSAVSRRRIERRWLGKRLTRRKRSLDSSDETDVLDTVDDCAIVCSITTQGLGTGAGQEKSLTAARLATAAIALLWETPSKALSGLNLLFDRQPHRQKVAVFVPGKGVLAGSYRSHMPHGPWLKTGEWEALFSERSGHFSVVAEVLDYVVSPSGAVARPKMMNVLAQALLWFHEGCRETAPPIAIVKFAAALDALAGGGGAPGIEYLMCTQLEIQGSQVIRQDGLTLKQAVKAIYSKGRSQMIHGTNDKMGHDWTDIRGLAEALAKLGLLACIECASENPLSDTPSQLSQKRKGGSA